MSHGTLRDAVPSTALEILIAADKLLDAPGKWCQYAAAMCDSGMSIDAYDQRAICWCATGAITKIVGGVWNLEVGKARRLLHETAREFGFPDARVMNDRKGTTFTGIKALYTHAIGKAQKMEADYGNLWPR